MDTGDGPKDNNDNTSAAEQWTLDQWIHELAESSDGNTYAMSQGGMHMGQGNNQCEGGCISAMPTMQTIRGMDMGQGNHQGWGGGISAMPTMQTISEPVHEEMLNMQSNVVEGILAPPASTFLGGCRSAAQTVRRERPAPNKVKIIVVTRKWPTDKRTRCTFDVDPYENVASLRVLLADKVDVPPNYHFYYNMAVMNESLSFQCHMIDGNGVGVPKIEVIDVTANSQLLILKRKNGQDDAGPSIHKTEAAKKIRNV